MLADARSGGALPAEKQKGKGRLPAAERRAAIVQAAIHRFARHGFRGTTTRELAAAAGVSEPVLYQHFATKRDLYTAIVDHLIEEAHERFDQRAKQLEAVASDREFLQWLGESILAYYLEDPDRIRLLLFSALEGHELADLWFEKATMDQIRWVERCLEKRIAAGTIRIQEPELVARAFIFMVGHFGLKHLLFPGRCSPAPDGKLVEKLVDIFLNGIAAPGEITDKGHEQS
jgi:AcrR family transcriptional regulator